MTNAPERIWAFYTPDDFDDCATITAYEMTQRGGQEYIRADLAQAAPQWQPIETAPDDQRVFVAGYRKVGHIGNVVWWFHLDKVFDGVPDQYPHATHWFPIIKPKFPKAPEVSK